MAQKAKESIIDVEDFKKVWNIFLTNWYIIFFALLIASLGSYIYTYRQQPLYSANLQILLKDQETYDYQTQLYRGLGYYNVYNDVPNQIRVITSYDLIQKAVIKLDMEVNYYIVGRIKKKELYSDHPFKVNADVLNPKLYGHDINFRFLNPKQYEISYELDEKQYSFKYPIGQRVRNSDLSIQIDKSRGVSDRTISKINQANYLFVINHIPSLVNKYKSSLTVSAVENTSILNLSSVDQVPKRAIAFLDTLSKIYVENTMQEQIDINENTLQYLDKQITQILDELNGVEDELEDFKSKKFVLDMDRQESEYFDKLLMYDTQKRKYQLDLQSLAALEKYIDDISNEDKLLPPSLYILRDDDFLISSINELYNMQILRNNYLYNATPGSRIVLEQDSKIALLKSNVFTYINNSIRAINLKIKDIDEQIDQITEIIKRIPKTQRGLLNITRKVEVDQRMYQYLLERRSATVTARAAILPSTKVIEKAKYIGQISPNAKKNLSYSITAALAISLIVIFVRTSVFYRIENAVQLRQYAKNPIYGEIVDSDEKSKDNYIVVDSDPKSVITECFRSVRTNLDFVPVEGNCRTVLITSNNPGEGKTFCSINLAAIIAKADKKVLVIELDLHKPKIQVGLNMKSEIGITSILVGKSGVEEAILKTSYENLDVLLAGPTPPNASELILSPKMAMIFEQIKQKYDYIIVDTPPIGLISDAFVLMKYCDSALLVLSTRYATPKLVETMNDIIANNKTKNFGYVINNVKKKRSKYYYNSYGYAYGYGYGYGYGGYGSGYVKNKKK